MTTIRADKMSKLLTLVSDVVDELEQDDLPLPLVTFDPQVDYVDLVWRWQHAERAADIIKHLEHMWEADTWAHDTQGLRAAVPNLRFRLLVEHHIVRRLRAEGVF